MRYLICLLPLLIALPSYAQSTAASFTVTAKWTNPTGDTIPTVGSRVERRVGTGPWQTACLGDPVATSCKDTPQPMVDSAGKSLIYEWRVIRFSGVKDSDASPSVFLDTGKPKPATGLGISVELNFGVTVTTEKPK